MNEVNIAKEAGFCFGVSRAIKILEDKIAEGKKIVTLGQIIHNKQVVDDFADKGVRVVNSPLDIKDGEAVVIRSHGVSKEVEETLKERQIEYIDATCPFVKKIHNIVMENHKEGKQIFIIGDEEHPEVQGINGWCNNEAIIISSVEDALNIKECEHPSCIVAQTTFERELCEKIAEIIKNTCKDVMFFDTICNTTNNRQKFTAEMAKKSDVFIVIGGKNSSNTKKLFNIAKGLCKNTFLVEGAWDLPSNIKDLGTRIGITAGASTPDWIIKEVFETMAEEKETINQGNGELSFAEALEASLVTLNTGQVVKGIVSRITPTEVYVDLGFKSEGTITLDELTNDPSETTATAVKIGEEVEVFVVRVNDADGTVKLSKKKIDAIKNWKTIEEANGTDTILEGKIIEAVNKGVIALVNGCRVFIPASLANDRFVSDLTSLIGKNVPLRIVSIKEDRRGKKAIGSVKSVVAEEKAKKSAEFWANVEVGKHYNGVVKTLTSFGAFVDLGGVDGLIHISELSWNRIKNPSEVVKVGEVVDVYILEANKETNKISLGFKKVEDNPWTIAQAKLNEGDVVNVKIVRLVPFGAFAEIIPGIDGLIHISQIANKRIGKPADVLTIGETVDAKIVEINWETKKIGLSIRALLAPEEAAPAEEVVSNEENTGAVEEITTEE